MKHPDGTVISSYFNLQKPDTEQSIHDGANISLGQVVKVHYIDDATNVSKSTVEYDVAVRDSQNGVALFKNLKKMADLGGTNDYESTILEASEFAFQNNLDISNEFKNTNGTIVVIAFFDGLKNKPFIMGAFPHPRKKGTSRSKKNSKLGEFRGITWEINADGELIIAQTGAKAPNGSNTNTAVGSTFKFDKTGNVSISNKNGSSLVLDNTTKKTTLAQGSVNISIEDSGKITLSVNSTKIIIDGTSGKIQLTGNLVDIGEAASALAVLGPQMIAWATSHTHIGNLGAPSSPPIVPPPSSLLSSSVKIKE